MVRAGVIGRVIQHRKPGKEAGANSYIEGPFDVNAPLELVNRFTSNKSKHLDHVLFRTP